MDAIRTGVIGVGHLGYHHARLYAAQEGVELVGVCDIDETRGREVADEFEALYFDSIDGLFEAGVDAVSLAVPTTDHLEVALRLFEAGVDVLVEKPIATTADQARAMVSAAASAGRILQVGHVERFNGAVLALMDAFERPRFIECHRMSPYPQRGSDVSVVLDLMIHDLEIVLALDGSKVMSIDAIGVSVFSKEEDIANVRLRFESGCVVNLTASRVSLESMRKIRIFQEDAYVSTDYSEQEVVVFRKKPGEMPADVSPMDWLTIEALKIQRQEPLKLELVAFAQSVKTRERPIVSGEDGLRALMLAEDITTFIRESR